jgi:hypothetical protein
MTKILTYLAVGFAADAVLRQSPGWYFVAGISYVTWKASRELE